SPHSVNGSEVHVICGSSRNLEAEVRAGRFREDLYYRLSGVCLRIPPLRQRKEDVPQLIVFFLTRYSETFNRPVPPLSTQTCQLFHEHTWPGNLVELEAVARDRRRRRRIGRDGRSALDDEPCREWDKCVS